MAIKKCKCESAFQDKKYGPQRRVHTPGNKCTVCGATNEGKSYGGRRGK